MSISSWLTIIFYLVKSFEVKKRRKENKGSKSKPSDLSAHKTTQFFPASNWSVIFYTTLPSSGQISISKYETVSSFDIFLLNYFQIVTRFVHHFQYAPDNFYFIFIFYCMQQICLQQLRWRKFRVSKDIFIFAFWNNINLQIYTWPLLIFNFLLHTMGEGRFSVFDS